MYPKINNNIFNSIKTISIVMPKIMDKKNNRDKFWSDNRYLNLEILNYFNKI